MIDPTTIQWTGRPATIPPTAAIAAIRVPGRDDLLVAVGENVDGTPTVPDASFPAAGLAESLVRTVAFQLIDDGTLDPSATVDQWAPTLPNADRVTVQMLLDDTTGWGDIGAIEPDPVVTDFARVWTLREVVEVRAPVIAVLAEPGTRTDDAGNNETVLGLVLEETTGHSLTDLVESAVAQPLGLDDTGLLLGRPTPADYRDGWFDFNGAAVKTSDFDGTSYLTWQPATHTAFSTPTDLLDLLDAWEAGSLFTTDRTPAPERFAAEPAEHPFLEYHHPGVGVPFNGFCPCAPVNGGIKTTAFGRTPGSIGTTTALLQFADGISVVVNVNSYSDDDIDLASVARELHDLAAGS